ncbi:hypothetical protein C0991_006345 [Blastosporella zonata]|nr:hypothetical protein C0991_006345 [Blastosporella zonata]
MSSSNGSVTPPDQPAFPPDDNIKVNGFIFRLAAIESKLIEQRELLTVLANEFDDFKGRYMDDDLANNTKDSLMTVALAVNAITAKVASIDDERVVNSLLN